MMRVTITGAVLALLLASGPTIAAEDTGGKSLHFSPGAGIGINKLRFTRADGSILRASYPTLNVDLTAGYGDFYAKAGAELFGQDFVRNAGEMKSVERDDYTLTFGAIVAPATNVFAGYTSGEMKDDFFGLFHEDRGYFVGAAYAIPFSDSSLGLSVAYANLDGRITDEVNAVEETGKTRGFGYALTWSGPFRDSMGYQVGVRVRLYEFKADGSGNVTEKNFASLFAGISF